MLDETTKLSAMLQKEDGQIVSCVDSSLRYWLALSLIRGLGGESARRLLKEFGSPETVLTASTFALKSFVKPELVSAIQAGIADTSLDAAIGWLADTNNHIVTLADSDYPQALLNINDPPLLLYVKGKLTLLNHPALAIVGSRHATPQGTNNAAAFAESLSAAGLCIISGMAHGIDSAAHRGALKAQGGSLPIFPAAIASSAA
jgi:DNA processing protein